MALSDITSLRKEVKALKKRVDQLESRDQELLERVLKEALSNYLDSNVEFNMTTEGQIKELINE